MDNNYFSCLGLPEQFDLDVAVLEKAYMAQQRAWHPDRWVGKPEAERLRATHAAMAVNAAYQTLKDPLTRAVHLLALHGIHVNGENDTVKPNLALLEEIMDWRERLAESTDKTTVMAQAQDAAATALAAVAAAFANNDPMAAAHAALRLQYLRKLLEEGASSLSP